MTAAHPMWSQTMGIQMMNEARLPTWAASSDPEESRTSAMAVSGSLTMQSNALEMGRASYGPARPIIPGHVRRSAASRKGTSWCTQ